MSRNASRGATEGGTGLDHDNGTKSVGFEGATPEAKPQKPSSRDVSRGSSGRPLLSPEALLEEMENDKIRAMRVLMTEPAPPIIDDHTEKQIKIMQRSGSIARARLEKVGSTGRMERAFSNGSMKDGAADGTPKGERDSDLGDDVKPYPAKGAQEVEPPLPPPMSRRGSLMNALSMIRKMSMFGSGSNVKEVVKRPSVQSMQGQNDVPATYAPSDGFRRLTKWIGSAVLPQAQEEVVDSEELKNALMMKASQNWNEGCSEVELKAFRRVFNFFDRHGEHKVPTQMIGSMMRLLGMNPTTAQVADLELQFDKKDDKTLNFLEFVQAMKTAREFYKNQRQDVMEAFHFFDEDKTGDITLSELKNIVIYSGEDLTSDEIDMVLADSDMSGDGKLDFIEFSNLMCMGGLIQFEVKQEAVVRIQRFYREKKARQARELEGSGPRARAKLY